MPEASYKPIPHVADKIIYNSVLHYLSARYVNDFSTLIIPEVVAVDLTREHGCLKWYNGVTFNNEWGHEDGGSRISADTSALLINIVEDLGKIDASMVANIFLCNGVPLNKFTFNVALWKESLRLENTTSKLSIKFNQCEIDQLQNIDIAEDKIFSNGDFYIRNIIKQDNGKAVLVDWNYFPGFRCCYVDHKSNVLAFAYIHMWGNTAWQQRFRSLAESKWNISPVELDNALVIKSVEQYLFLTDNNGRCDKFCEAMIKTAKDALRRLK